MSTPDTRASYQYKARVVSNGEVGPLIAESDNLQVLAVLAGSYFTAQQNQAPRLGLGVAIYNLSGVEIAWVSVESE